MIPDKRVVGAADVVVGSVVGLAAPAVVHDPGALFVSYFQVRISSGVDAGRAAGRQHENGSRGGHAFELAAAGGAVAAHGARHVGAVPAAVIPFVVASALVGDAAGGATADALSFKIGMDVVDVAVVEPGVVEADRLRGAVVAVHYELFQIAAIVGSRHVVHGDGIRIVFNRGDLAHFGQARDLRCGQPGDQGGAERLRGDLVGHSFLIQDFFHGWQEFAPGHGHQHAALITGGSNWVEFADRLVFRQEFSQIEKGKNFFDF